MNGLMVLYILATTIFSMASLIFGVNCLLDGSFTFSSFVVPFPKLIFKLRDIINPLGICILLVPTVILTLPWIILSTILYACVACIKDFAHVFVWVFRKKK